MPHSRSHPFILSRRRFSAGALAVGALGGAVPACAAGLVISVRDLDLRRGGQAAIQAALDDMARRGGGTLLVGTDVLGGELVIRGSNITIDGAGGTLRDTRLIVAREARNFAVRDLTLLETRGRPENYQFDIAGRGCRFERVKLIKRPRAGGYQGYLRETSGDCTFDRLELDGSNGLFVAGTNHLFENFEFTSTLTRKFGGDDAFAIKGPGTVTDGITIRNGIVRGYAAAVSIGSEVGSSVEQRGAGVVRNVRVENIEADRCQRAVFIKPGGLDSDWRNGLVENIWIDTIRLRDPGAYVFSQGIGITTARGATIRNVVVRNVVVEARAETRGVMQTAAIDITIRSTRPPASIENIDLQVVYSDGGSSSGHAIDKMVRIEKDDPGVGRMRDIRIDITGENSLAAGIYVGRGLDNAVTITRARLRRVALDPPASVGTGGVWADSSVRLGDVQVENVAGVARGGSGRQLR